MNWSDLIMERHAVVENNKNEIMSQNVNVFHARFFCHTTLIKIAFFFLLLNSTGIELRTQK